MGITQFNKERRPLSLRKAKWPESPKTNESVFDRRESLRKLVVMIDHELLDESNKTKTTDKLDKSILLKSLLYSDLIECYRYAEGRPPETAQPIEVPHYRDTAYIGYVVLSMDNSKGFWPVSYALDDQHISMSAISGNAYDVARKDIADQTYKDKAAADKRQSDVLALQTAQECLEADIYITRRLYLYSKSGIVSGRGVTICTPEDAITAISLYLRAQQQFVIPTGEKKVRMTLNRGLFYWVGTRELLPEGWRWFSACVAHSTGIKDDKILYLGSAALSRTQRALEFRDQVHMAMNAKTNNDINDSALGGLDSVLMLLVGAVDATAQVAHHALGLDPNKAHTAAWQRDWVKKSVEPIRPTLAKIVAVDSDNWHTLTILTKLRNSIHGEPIRGMTKQSGSETTTVIALPSKDEETILQSMDALGGREAWGVKPLTPNLNEVNPSTFVDKLFEETIGLLNDIMKETPVKNLSHTEKVSEISGPPADKPGDAFSKWHRTSIRWQLGF